MKIMAVDFGDSRTGLAICDNTELLASPIGIIAEKNFFATAKKVIASANEQKAELIVVGLPMNMNGTKGPRAELCEKFAERLRTLSQIPVILWDERSTTVSAAGILNEANVRGKKRKESIDAVAATLILESYLNYRKNHKN